MKRRVSLLDTFGIVEEKNSLTDNYEMLDNNKLLETLKNNIMKHIMNDNLSLDESYNECIKDFDLSDLDKSNLYNLVSDELKGFGPLAELMNDKNITEIMVNGPDEIYIVINGQIIKEENVSFINNEHIIRTINGLVDTNELSINTKLEDGSIIKAVLPPLSLNGPILVIKKVSKGNVNIDDLIGVGMLTPYMARFLESCVLGKLNILISGSFQSGKTTLTNVLSNFIYNKERIITIENNWELNLKQDNVIRLRNNEKLDKFIFDLRPDRLVIDEYNKDNLGYFFESGFIGVSSIGTITAKDGISALKRIKTLTNLNNIDDLILDNIDLVVNVERLSNGRIKVSSISELCKSKNNEVMLKDIFVFKKESGSFIRYDFYPDVVNKLKTRGINNIDYIFENPGDNDE